MAGGDNLDLVTFLSLQVPNHLTVMAAYHLVYGFFTYGLTAKKLGSAPYPVLIVKYRTTVFFLFTDFCIITPGTSEVNKLRSSYSRTQS